jgi:GNAT superfamily N-acetyltransferase
MNAQAIDIRRMTAQDQEAFAALFRTCTGRHFPAGLLPGKYTAPDGPPFMAHMAFNAHGEAVAALGLMGHWLQRGDRRIRAAQAVDAITLPAYRRQGLFRRLVQANEALAREAGVDLLFGFAQHERGSAVGLRNMGWTASAPLLHHAWATSVPPGQRVLRRLAPARAARRRETVLKEAAVSPGTLDEAAMAGTLFARADAWHAVRDRDALHGRAGPGPLVLRVPGGHAWASVRDREMRIGDLFGPDHQALLKATIALAGRIGCDTVALVGAVDHALDDLLRRLPAMVRPTGGEVLRKPLSTRAPADHEPVLFTSGDADTF